MPGIEIDNGRENLGATGFLGMISGVKATIKLSKAGYKIADLLGLLNIKAEPHAHSYQVLDSGKKLLSTSEIPDKLITLWKKSSDVVTEGPSVKGFRAVVGAITALWSSVQDAIEEFYKNISPENAMLLEKIGGVMLEVGMSCLLWKDISDITKKTDKLDHLRRDLPTAEALGSRAGDARAVTLRKYIHGLEAQRTNKMIKVAQWTSYFALGAPIIAAAFFGVGLGPRMLLAATTAVVLNNM